MAKYEKKRCSNPKTHNYKNYGGRGISVCKRWLNSFENFYADMGDAPQDKQLDRIDNDKGYGPSNCRWVTREINANNRSSCIRITFNNETLTLKQWADKLSRTYGCMSERVRLGWSDEKIVTTPVRKHKEYKNAA